MTEISFKPIGYVKSPFDKNYGVPIQSAVAFDTEGSVEILPEFAEGLADLEGFSHIILIVENIDIVDGTPVLDIKPYVAEFDSVIPESIGWLKKNIQKLPQIKDNGRFSGQ